MSKYTENFRSIANAIYDEAPSEKARLFCEKIVNQILEKGDSWIDQNFNALHIYTSAQEQEEMGLSVEANRLFYLTQWQKALA